MKCRFCHKTISNRTIQDLSPLDRLELHVEKCHPEEAKKLKEQAKEATHGHKPNNLNF
jgi:hypothetical protein